MIPSQLRFQFDREKFKSVVHYVCATCEPSQLGAVKLNKVLYFSDMVHFATRGVPITGAAYRKRQFGPATNQLLPVLRELYEFGAIDIEEVDYFGYLKKQYTSCRPPNTARLNADEKALLDDAIDFVCRNNTAKTISEFSHNRAWEIAEPGAELPYHSAFLMFPVQVSQEAFEWAANEAKEIETKTARGESLVRRDFQSFRSRVLAKSGDL